MNCKMVFVSGSQILLSPEAKGAGREGEPTTLPRSLSRGRTSGAARPRGRAEREARVSSTCSSSSPSPRGRSSTSPPPPAPTRTQPSARKRARLMTGKRGRGTARTVMTPAPPRPMRRLNPPRPSAGNPSPWCSATSCLAAPGRTVANSTNTTTDCGGTSHTPTRSSSVPTETSGTAARWRRRSRTGSGRTAARRTRRRGRRRKLNRRTGRKERPPSTLNSMINPRLLDRRINLNRPLHLSRRLDLETCRLDNPCILLQPPTDDYRIRLMISNRKERFPEILQQVVLPLPSLPGTLLRFWPCLRLWRGRSLQ